MKFAKFTAEFKEGEEPIYSLLAESPMGQRKHYFFDPCGSESPHQELITAAQWASRILDPENPNG